MPRAGLTPAVVTAAAADLADENGWEQLTLAAVATRLGVRQPSLYKHVASLAALRRAVSQLAVTELGAQLAPEVAGRSGGDALRHLAAAYRRYAHEHPGRYAASVIAPAAGDDEHARVSAAVLRTIGAVLRGYGIGANGDGAERDGAERDGAERDGANADGAGGEATAAVFHAIRGLRAVLHGFVALEAAGGFAMALDPDESYRLLIDGFDASLRRWDVTAAGHETNQAAASPDERGPVTDR